VARLKVYRGVVATPLTNTPSPTRDAFLATTALGRIGQPEEIAKTILFLLSDEASFITASVGLFILSLENADHEIR
jgi:NAD(P)-dependent dehydrogenase (short-subunit alcohol dehydrogenase family)